MTSLDKLLAKKSKSLKSFTMIDNYIYLYNLGVYLVLPTYGDGLNDTMSVTFSSNTPIGRSAPIYSYNNSGPRSIQFTFDLHREMFAQINRSNTTISDDYTDTLINYIQAAAYPTYEEAAKAINPPIVALRMGDDIFIKGVISGSVGVSYGLPVLRNGKYAHITLAFGINEIDPYDATTVSQIGSYRNSTLTRSVSGTSFASKANALATGTTTSFGELANNLASSNTTSSFASTAESIANNQGIIV